MDMELGAKKIGRKTERPNSTSPAKINLEIIPKIELPKAEKKMVKFALDEL